MRKEYEMTEEDLKELLESCKSDPVIYGSGGVPLFQTQQEKANAAWEKLADKYNFKWDSVMPVSGKGNRFFTAIPNDK
jgi:hypothetical protein